MLYHDVDATSGYLISHDTDAKLEREHISDLDTINILLVRLIEQSISLRTFTGGLWKIYEATPLEPRRCSTTRKFAHKYR